VARKKPVVEGRPGIADVQHSCRGRRKPHARPACSCIVFHD
jgi:hypothetical protein